MCRHGVLPAPQAIYLGEVSFGQVLYGGVVVPLLRCEDIQLVLRTECTAYGHLADLLRPDVHDVLHEPFRLLPALVRTFAHHGLGIYRHLFVELYAKSGQEFGHRPEKIAPDLCDGTALHLHPVEFGEFIECHRFGCRAHRGSILGAVDNGSPSAGTPVLLFYTIYGDGVA